MVLFLGFLFGVFLDFFLLRFPFGFLRFFLLFLFLRFLERFFRVFLEFSVDIQLHLLSRYNVVEVFFFSIFLVGLTGCLGLYLQGLKVFLSILTVPTSLLNTYLRDVACPRCFESNLKPLFWHNKSLDYL